MLIAHDGAAPRVDPTAWVAPNAVLCGDVALGPGTRIGHGAQVIAEAGGSIALGACCIVMENAVIRAGARHPTRIGNHCLIGPSAHVVGATLADQVFVATGAAVFHGSSLGTGAEVRIHGVVHLKSRLAPGAVVPIGWVAVGDPAEILPPSAHDEIWALQEPLDFPGTVYGVPRGTPDLMRQVTERLSARLGRHEEDEVVDRGGERRA